ncbi:glycosyltransferase WbsX family protein [Acinetobacter johnsonii]|uniref:glycosyltransferase WbsX family protein n=1 Tax=Acinetobacter johnsonii TaxID=40214 RepID=UPI002D7EC708|nr:glycoside hydrolase family 99-like domain-containing protein [Acinetobacter johnsonii]
MKIYAFYLPQFHTIAENDEWWGKGFTEWVNVKKAKPLFSDHDQPKVPLDNYYYDLSDKETLKWQSDLMKKYKVDGLCFYHYWFTGQQLLQKPAEILLENKDIDLPFLFSWANEPWTRTWDGGDKHVLMPQNYGTEKNWIDHFNYLLPFFKDSRYQKHNGKPIFLLYRSTSFIDCAEWMKCWRSLASKSGIGDIHFVSMQTIFEEDKRSIGFDAKVYFEPVNTIRYSINIGVNRLFNKISNKTKAMSNTLLDTNYIENSEDYDEIWSNILAKKIGEYNYSGAFVSWDNTPRKGTKGLYIKNFSTEKFKKYFDLLYSKSKENNVPYLFINAWNEWAEGTYLEPDIKNEYKCLEAIKSVVSKYND